MLFLFPKDYFDAHRPEELYSNEFDAAREIGEDVCLVDYDALLAGEDPFPRGYDGDNLDAVWRGWQMTSDTYRRFWSVAMSHNVRLITSPDVYDINHHLNLAYPRIREHTAPSFFSSAPFDVSIAEVFDVLGSPVFVKDTVKGHHFSPCVITDADSPADAASKIDALIRDRGESYSGIIVFRQWREYIEETRFMVVGGNVVCSGRHNSDGNLSLDDVHAAGIYPEILGAGSLFHTVDCAFDTIGGNIEVVEMGDGQVSEAPQNCSFVLIEALSRL